MRKNPGVFPCIPEPELGRVMEEVDLNSTRFECCLPGRAVRFAGTVEKRGDTTYHAMLKSVEVDGKNVLSDFRT
ncbi:MAG TPA: hypothetical protein VN420_00905 [Candidatus Fimivivens sp.]|nr:hypothetical protein [Candidatus Fimivivens sp.]